MNDLPSCSTPLGVGKAANLSINPYFVRRIPPFLKGGSFKIYLLSFIFLSSISAEERFVYTQVISKIGHFGEAGAQNLKQAEPTWRRAPVGEGAQIRKAGGFLNLGGASREGFKFGDAGEAKSPSFESSWVYPHGEIKQYSMHGNFQKGLATESMGAKQFEVWRASIAVGSKTPLHAHETEEIFIVLKGKMLVLIGEEEVECTAPATLICPANVPHQLINIGDEPTDHILVLGVGSTIWNENGEEMKLPWR